MERTVLARLHYDGTHFAGWQRQRQGRTVQGEVEAALERLCGRRVPVHAAGRTDAGVHALGLAVSATVPARWTPASLHRAWNALLPRDCWVADVTEAQAGFHARKSATARSYEYRIGTEPAARSPFRRPFEWALGHALDAGPLERCAAAVIGCHDFRGLAVQMGGRAHGRCEVREAAWSPRTDQGGVRFRIVANRFLHHMVRMVVGTMVDIARGRRSETDLSRLLALDPAVRASPPAPPQGLYFVAAEYPAHWLLAPEPTP